MRVKGEDEGDVWMRVGMGGVRARVRDEGVGVGVGEVEGEGER